MKIMEGFTSIKRIRAASSAAWLTNPRIFACSILNLDGVQKSIHASTKLCGRSGFRCMRRVLASIDLGSRLRRRGPDTDVSTYVALESGE